MPFTCCYTYPLVFFFFTLPLSLSVAQQDFADVLSEQQKEAVQHGSMYLLKKQSDSYQVQLLTDQNDFLVHGYSWSTQALQKNTFKLICKTPKKTNERIKIKTIYYQAQHSSPSKEKNIVLEEVLSGQDSSSIIHISFRKRGTSKAIYRFSSEKNSDHICLFFIKQNQSNLPKNLTIQKKTNSCKQVEVTDSKIVEELYTTYQISNCCHENEQPPITQFTPNKALKAYIDTNLKQEGAGICTYTLQWQSDTCTVQQHEKRSVHTSRSTSTPIATICIPYQPSSSLKPILEDKKSSYRAPIMKKICDKETLSNSESDDILSDSEPLKNKASIPHKSMKWTYVIFLIGIGVIFFIKKQHTQQKINKPLRHKKY